MLERTYQDIRVLIGRFSWLCPKEEQQEPPEAGCVTSNTDLLVRGKPVLRSEALLFSSVDQGGERFRGSDTRTWRRRQGQKDPANRVELHPTSKGKQRSGVLKSVC